MNRKEAGIALVHAHNAVKDRVAKRTEAKKPKKAKKEKEAGGGGEATK